MGLEKGNRDSLVYVGMHDGKFTIRVTEDTEGAEKRELQGKNSKGKIIWELVYKKLSGKINKIEYLKKDFGPQLEITVIDDKTYVLQLPWGLPATNKLVARLPNVDYTQAVTFSVFKDKETGRSVVLIYQRNEKVLSAYTKDNPNGMPKAKETISKGEKTWDYGEVDEFLYNVVQKEKERLEGEKDIDDSLEVNSEFPGAKRQDEDCPF